ncbi:excalibur calcium-binding domain-containing protein [Kribbella steppae]|uniref:Excalibur calcium-binding domain-containing protein n=1 Tax=Kribbella steppae TaxID=2512223 RepID=A0A4R2HB53_9ACTN|nr:excalibur calcium-binding domain-containing protein [Kribbella steppae]TCO24571.1 excalibur calcium-binding domain-containing protein [Kribbella steppae]
MNGELRSVTNHRKLTGSDRGNATLAALAGVAVGVLLVLLTWLVVLLNRTDPADRAANTPTAAPATASAPATAPAPVKTVTVAPSVKGTATAPKAVGDVRALPAGLFCRDLKAKGFSYVAAIDYWRLHGQTNQMDADRNGIPCETVYSRSDVALYWHGREISGTTPLAAGLFCRDLAARGATYGEAVAYWWYYNLPARMDADNNGIPCETVYSTATVNAFWFS